MSLQLCRILERVFVHLFTDGIFTNTWADCNAFYPWYGMDILWNHPLFFIIATGILFVFCLKLQCISYLLKHYSDDHHRSYQPYHDDDDGFEGNYSYNYGYNPYRPPSGGIKGKVEQKYWHTKQTVIQKLGKEQDSFVVAGDSEVDARLEVHCL